MLAVPPVDVEGGAAWTRPGRLGWWEPFFGGTAHRPGGRRDAEAGPVVCGTCERHSRRSTGPRKGRRPGARHRSPDPGPCVGTGAAADIAKLMEGTARFRAWSR